MSRCSTGNVTSTVLLAAAALLGACMEDLAVGLSAFEPDDASASEDPSVVADASARADAGDGRDASPGVDASDGRDARAALDASKPDASGGPRDARVADAAPGLPDASSCTRADARSCAPAADAGTPVPCSPGECVVMITPTDLCDEGIGMACERGEDGYCDWVCVPPLTVLADKDASSGSYDAGN